MTRDFTILIFILLASFWSCSKIEKLPDEPRVEFRSMELFDTIDILGNQAKASRLSFYFEDGDGDLGLNEDTLGTTTESNLFLNLFRKVDNEFVKVTSSDPLFPSDYRIPYLETPGQIKILRGTINVTIIYFIFEDTDTIYYDFRIQDRSGHESNRDTTCVIILGQNGKCSS